MLCPACKANDNKVIDSRLTEGGMAIRRRRACQVCDRRFTTKERLEEELRISVLKCGGQRVPYERNKILYGIERACYKLDITEAELQKLVDRVEGELLARHEREVGTDEIGRFVGRELRRLHPVAYVRFMSVHRKYNSVDEFIDEIRDVQVRASHEHPNQQPLFGE